MKKYVRAILKKVIHARVTLEAWEFKGPPKDFYDKKVLYLRLDYTEELCAQDVCHRDLVSS